MSIKFHRIEISNWMLIHSKCLKSSLLETYSFFNFRAAIFGFINGINNCDTIYKAAKNGHLEIIEYLHEACHVNVETKDNNGYTLIDHAAYYGHLEVVKYLYETCNVEVTYKTVIVVQSDEIMSYFRSLFREKPFDFESDIFKASENGKLTSIKCLIDKYHANIETKDNKGRTPINNASENGHLKVVKYLYET